MTTLIKTLAIGIALLLPQATTPVPPATAQAKTATFHSDPLQFDYIYDSSLVTQAKAGDDAIKTEQNNSTGATKAAMSCLSLPLTAMNTADGLRMVLIMRMDTKCMGQTVKPESLSVIATSAFSESLHRLGAEPVLSTASSYLVGGNSAAVLSGSVDSKQAGSMVYGIASCALINGDVACWELLSTTCSSLPVMMSYPVAFKGQNPVALIPSKFAPACKS